MSVLIDGFHDTGLNCLFEIEDSKIRIFVEAFKRQSHHRWNEKNKIKRHKNWKKKLSQFFVVGSPFTKKNIVKPERTFLFCVVLLYCYIVFKANRTNFFIKGNQTKQKEKYEIINT